MLRKTELIIYLTVLLSFITGIFLFMPAVAKQEQNNPPSPPVSKGEVGGLPMDEEENIQKIMKVLEEKEKELIRREEALKKEEERLNMLKNSLELSLKEYSAMRDRLHKELASNSGKNGQSQQWIGYIAKVYESMSPAEAAQRIEKMDNGMAVELLSKIKSKQTGKILGAISADKAASLTEKMAERKGDQ